MFARSTPCTALAKAFTIPRYALALTGARSRLRFGSFQTWNTCSAGRPYVPSKRVASACAKSPSAAAFGVPAMPVFGRFAYAQRGVPVTSKIGVTFAESAACTVASSQAHE